LEITPLIPAGRQFIEGYGPGSFRISGTLYHGSLIVFPDRCLEWEVVAAEGISLLSLRAVASATPLPEILLLGTGRRHEFVSRQMREELKAAGIRAESMDTGAACRTYNVLLSEERRVAAALIGLV
jgi:uncharacterized protein